LGSDFEWGYRAIVLRKAVEGEVQLTSSRKAGSEFPNYLRAPLHGDVALFMADVGRAPQTDNVQRVWPPTPRRALTPAANDASKAN